MALSDKIESFIIELLKNEEDGCLEIGRNELASIFNCVPSPITYVISTRFNSNNGYMVESRRGGGGSMRITRLAPENNIYMTAIKSVGESIDIKNSHMILDYLLRNGAVTDGEYRVMCGGVDDKSIRIAQPMKNAVRADILKNMIAAKAAEVQH